MAIIFDNQHPSISIPNSNKLTNWLNLVAKSESYIMGRLSYTFFTDAALLKVNQDFLQHDTYTDIITFDYNKDNMVIGEIYISLDRVKENANINNQLFLHEFCRILVHGLLHLLGYKDKTPEEKLEMTSKEDLYLSLLPQKF